MSLTLGQTKTALAINLTASFLGIGGTPPYAYSVRSGGAGGAINGSTGVYTAPPVVPADPALVFDTVIVRDSLGAQAQSAIMVGTPLLLFCEILQQQLGLPVGRVFIWDQKIFQPTDAGLYIAVSVPRCKPFSNNIKPASNSWTASVQDTNFMATLDINAISRDTSALNRKEEILLALNSVYAQKQQEGNSFLIGRISPNSQFLNLSMVDGAAIPYRYQISINIQYVVSKTEPVDYYDTFQGEQLTVNP